VSHLSMDEVFSAHGLLADALDTFKPRAQQLDMAEAVTRAITQFTHAVIEAGTGTGKTFAYLVPALLSDKKVVISTATKTLQDQIFEKDLPQIAKILGVPSIIALLKGRRNYLCKYRLHKVLDLPQHLNGAQQKELDKIKIWAQVTKTGDISELHSVPESSSIWGFVTSSPEVCSVKTCGSDDLCFATKARRKAMAADVVIVNHHLLLADTKLKEEGFGDLLPEVDVVVVDEAHQIADLATQIFGTQWSANRVLRWFRDAQLQATKDQQHKLIRDLDALQKQVRETRLALRGKSERMIWSDVPKAFVDELQELHFSMRELTDAIKVLSDDDDWEQLWKRLRSLMSGLDVFVDDVKTKDETDIVNTRIRWLDVTVSGFTIYDTPVDIAEQFKDLMQRYAKSWVFTSATLAVGESFRGFAEPLGIKESTEFVLLDSSFNYPAQSLLFLPKNLPEPNHPHFSQAFTELAIDLIRISGGGVFLLFTSYRMLNLVAELLRGEFNHDIPNTILVQGEMQRASLLNKFREDGDAILLGTSTFWEGVDVPGSALRLVLIDKLPFASPGDPVLSARINSMKQRGLNAFSQLQLPQAVITLKQGVGRLIRNEDDYGVMVICDPRLKTKGYGKTFLKSLPPMPKTDSIDRVRKFYKFYEHV